MYADGFIRISDPLKKVRVVSSSQWVAHASNLGWVASLHSFSAGV